ncbi:MAG: hypothetical protein AAF628_18955 [Planctomycetota bacterium]
MFRSVLLIVVSLCGLQAPAPAQLQVGARLGRHVSVHAEIGPRVVVTGRYERGAYDVPRGPRSTRGDWARRRVVYERVWVPGYWDTIQVPPVYETRCDRFGRSYQVLVREGYCDRVWRQGYYKRVPRRVRRY